MMYFQKEHWRGWHGGGLQELHSAEWANLPTIPLLGTCSHTSHKSKAVTALFADRHRGVDVSQRTKRIWDHRHPAQIAGIHCTAVAAIQEPRVSCLRYWQSCSGSNMEGWTNCLKSWVNIQTDHPWCYSWTTKSVKVDFQLCCIMLQWLWSRSPPPSLHRCGTDTILV